MVCRSDTNAILRFHSFHCRYFQESLFDRGVEMGRQSRQDRCDSIVSQRDGLQVSSFRNIRPRGFHSSLFSGQWPASRTPVQVFTLDSEVRDLHLDRHRIPHGARARLLRSPTTTDSTHVNQREVKA